MALERDDNRVEMICDGCDDGYGKSFDKDDFDIMVDKAKKKNWTIIKIGAKWKHYCPKCP